MDSTPPEPGADALDALADTLAARRVTLERRVTQFTNAWPRLRRAVASWGRNAPAVAETLVTAEDYAGLALTIQAIQEFRAELGRTEAFLSRELGRAAGMGLITLPSGAHAEVRKAKDRKEWRHQDWQRDVRAKVAAALAEDLPALVDPETGETVDLDAILFSAMAEVQAIHGAGAPKVTALKALDLDPEDYCTSAPGPWSLQVTASQPATENK